MKNIVFFFLFMSSFSACGQEVVKLGVKFSVKDSLVVMENLDRKFKSISITESDDGELIDIELKSKIDIEGDVVHDHRLYTKNGVIIVEIVSGNKKRKFQIQRPKKQNK